MKKIIIKGETENRNLYFDFRKDFPMLGCELIEEPGFTDSDADTEWVEAMQTLISSEPHEKCTEDDYEYVRSLVKAWGLKVDAGKD